MKEKDRQHFGTAEIANGPLEGMFRRLDFKTLDFGTFGEMSSNVKEVVDMAVDGTPRPDDGGHDSAPGHDNIAEALHDATLASSMVGHRLFDAG